ncbi:uncharacterized protein LOC131254899 isoform X2 [Magnolia sinica]|uniref:uncharacterized protein LOC131254899 isoform X2 n=1 Tax=Magnolia sinica TaxID=86752 RepID=UPI00265A52EA|nr:uncharacterized protein LOC131254899 isoform X2 [Magnolia sinica]
MDFPLFRAPIFYLNPPSIESQSISVRSPTSSSFERRFSHAISCRRMSCELETAPPTLRTVTISYSELQDKDGDLSMKIENGFGPNGLGIISVSDVPGFPLLRQNLLRLSPRLASLPEEVKKELEDPDSRYGFGWSHGKETLESGKLDMLKGSFYANPVLDTPTTEASLVQRYPSYCRPNIWPSNALPELEEAFKALGKLMLDVGLMLGYHCDRYVTKVDPLCNDESLKQILLHSRCHKGRLLYYFPVQQSDCTQDLGNMSSWCGWHTDHGSLTGLTCGMFTRDGVEIACPDSAAGLYIRTRTDRIVKIVQFRNAVGMFGHQAAKMSRTTMMPCKWWAMYVTDREVLRRFVVPVLTQTVSSSPCERNWSTFSLFHTNKRNRLGYEQL